MADQIREQFAEINEVGDALRLIADCAEVRAGTLRFASGVTRGMLTFEEGHITSAAVTSSGDKGVEALEKILALPDAAFEFAVGSDVSADKIWIDIKALISNSLSLKGLPVEEPAVSATVNEPLDFGLTEEVPSLFSPEGNLLDELADSNSTTEIPLYPRAAKKAEEPKVEVEVEELKVDDDELPHLDMSEQALSDEQRKLLKAVSDLRDVETFEAEAPELQAEPEMMLREAQLEILEKVEVDQGPFSQAEMREVLEDHTSLSEDQKALLEMSKALANKEAFDYTDVKIETDEEGPVISQEERWIIEQNKNLLTPEQQLEEFVRDDEELAKTREQNIEFKPFVDSKRLSETAESEAETAELDAIETPNVLDEDRAPLIAMPKEGETEADRLIKKEPKGLIGRVSYMWGSLPAYSKTVRKQFMRPERILGPVIFCGLTLSLFILPGYLQKMARGSSDASGLESVRTTVADELDDTVPDALNDPEEAGKAVVDRSGRGGGGMNNTGMGGPESAGSDIPQSADEGALAQARTLMGKGWTKRALALYRTYLALHPKAMAIRIELIKALISANERVSARIECIEALKLKPSFEQTEEIGRLFGSVQTN